MNYSPGYLLVPVGLSGTVENHASFDAGIVVALVLVIATLLLMDFWLIGVRLRAMVQESEIPTWEDRPAVFPVKTMSLSLTAGF